MVLYASPRLKLEDGLDFIVVVRVDAVGKGPSVYEDPPEWAAFPTLSEYLESEINPRALLLESSAIYY